MKTHHTSDALSCGQSKVEHKYVNIYLFPRMNATFSITTFNSSDFVYIQRNVSLQIALITPLVCTQKSRANVLSLPVDHLTLRYKFDRCDTTLKVIVNTTNKHVGSPCLNVPYTRSVQKVRGLLLKCHFPLSE